MVGLSCFCLLSVSVFVSPHFGSQCFGVCCCSWIVFKVLFLNEFLQ